jgi:hypothetical protein
MPAPTSRNGFRRGRLGLAVLVAGATLGVGTAAAAAAAAADAPSATPHSIVLKHPTCNNDPGFDPSNEPLCAWQHHGLH